MYKKEHQQLLEKYKKENKPTYHEKLFEDILKTYKVKYIPQKGFIAECYVCSIVDFYLPKPHKLIIEIDGEYHNPEKDSKRDWFFLTRRGMRTLRFTNKQVEDPELIKSILTKVLNA